MIIVYEFQSGMEGGEYLYLGNKMLIDNVFFIFFVCFILYLVGFIYSLFCFGCFVLVLVVYFWLVVCFRVWFFFVILYRERRIDWIYY